MGISDIAQFVMNKLQQSNDYYTNGKGQQDAAYFGAIKNGNDPQRAMLDAAQTQALNVQTEEAQRQAEAAKQLPVVLQNLKGRSPDEVFQALSPIIGAKDASAFAQQMQEQALAEEKAALEQEKYATDTEFKQQELDLKKQQFSADAGTANLQREKLTAEINKLTNDTGKTDFKRANDLRDEFNNLSGEFVKQRDAHTRVLASAEDPSAAGDLSLIFNYMKVLDPGSTVREGEFATAAAAGSFGERIKAAVNKVQSGELLTPEMRDDFVKRSKALYNRAEKTQKPLVDRYTRMADDFGVDPNLVVEDLGAHIEANQDVLSPGGPLPETAQGDGVTQEDWDAMTAEERALWH